MKAFQFFNFVREFQRNKEKAREIKADTEKRPKSVRFGLASVFSSVLGVACSLLIGYGLKWLLSDNFLYVIAGAVVGLIGLFGAIAAVYKAIESWGFQIYINKNALTWISLLIWIAAIAAIAVITILIST